MYNYNSFNILLYDFELKSHKNTLATSLALNGKIRTLTLRLHVVSISVQSKLKNWYVFKENRVYFGFSFKRNTKVELYSKIALTIENGQSYDCPTFLTIRGYFFLLSAFFYSNLACNWKYKKEAANRCFCFQMYTALYLGHNFPIFNAEIIKRLPKF